MKLALLVLCALVAAVAVSAQAGSPAVAKPAGPVAPVAAGTAFANANCAAGTCKYSSKCQPCNAGTYEPAWGKACAADTASQPGHPCANVPTPGRWAPAGSAKTFPCPAGSTSAGGRTATGCVQCNYGTVNAKAGGKCELCPEGTYQAAPGQTKCKKCPAKSSSVPDRGQCVRANGAPATKVSLLEVEGPQDEDLPHPFTPITPGTKFPGNTETPIEKLKARASQE